ncbi:MAG: beta-L-arabinofuranosidase domain-containing protein [Prevotella sp.]
MIQMKKMMAAVCCSMASLTVGADGVSPRIIKEVKPVEVSCPEGTAPRLPHLVWVNYSDGQSEYRQVRWNNSALATEKEQADSKKNPAGKSYKVKGYIIGDETTEQGFPISAEVKVVNGESGVPPTAVVHTLPLADVTLNGDNRLTWNRDEALREICSWDVTQQLYNYRDTYGLPTEGYTVSDGWDAPDCKLKGHGSGHYMSALAQAYAVATDPVQKDILRKNIVRMVDELRQCQERTFVYDEKLGRYWEARDFAPEEELLTMKGSWSDFDTYKKKYKEYGYGYINAIPAQHCALIEKYAPYNNTDGVWAPYYSVHKQLAGLIDIANLFDDKATAEKALTIAKDMGLWVWNRMHYRTYVKQDGTQEERRQRPGNRYEMWDMYIAGEVGGISESLARLSEMVSDKEEKAKLLEASNCFDAPKFFDPLSRNIDDIRTRHANQHIPMIIGALRSYKGNGNTYYYNIAQNFWTLLQGRYVYATGGVGNGEMFRQPYTQTLSMATNGMQEGEAESNPDINETCCAYNLLKLTRDLNCYNPDDASYMDYYERVLYNQIIGSLNSEHYQTCYQYAVGLNATKPFGNETPQATCCGGTGSENHTKYQEAAYFVNENSLYVSLYLPTSLYWKEKGMKIVQDCLWPAEHSKITIAEGKGKFTMKLRVPYWATKGFTVKLNGKTLTSPNGGQTCSSYYFPIERKWKKGDVIEVEMPFTKHINYSADKLTSDVASADGVQLDDAWVGTLMYGPLAMTGTDVMTWSDATLNIDSQLDNITANPPTADKGVNGNLYTLTVNGQTFQPDYYRTSHTTHYYRINHTDAPQSGVTEDAAEVDKTELQALIAIAEERVAEQDKWAPNGYWRLVKALDDAKMVDGSNGAMTQKKVNGAAAKLNKAINTMRPGNLAEVEDLRQLTGLLRRAGTIDENSSAELREAVEYAEMVKKYVTDGSGTHDMIGTAAEKLRKAMEN